jgi:hypothetical protein
MKVGWSMRQRLNGTVVFGVADEQNIKMPVLGIASRSEPH